MAAMLGAEAAELLAAAVGGAGARVLSAQPVQVTWRPRRSLCVSYDVSVAWSKHQRTTERFVASTGNGLPQGALILARDEEQVAVWRMTGDPALPGLAIAMDPARVGELLNGLGAPDVPVSTQVRAYRPGRRAVVEVGDKCVRFFLKVVPPAEVPALQERHKVMAAHLPVPRSHGWSSEHGLVVLEALPGATLRACLLTKRLHLPDPSEFTGLLDGIPDLPDGRPAHSPVSALADHAVLVKSVLPELEERVERLLEALSAREDALPKVSVHGDLHEAQVLVRDGAIVGLLDIDSAGWGHRMDDWANFLGHLSAWELSTTPAARPRIAKFARGILVQAEAETGNPAELRRRVAAVVVGMATGPFRAQSRTWPADTRSRIALAERWAADARQAAA